MRRISASNLRFFSVMYVYVHFRRKSRVLLELLAFEPFYFAGNRLNATKKIKKTELFAYRLSAAGKLCY